MTDLFLIFNQTDTAYHTDRVYLFEIQRKRKNIIKKKENVCVTTYLFFHQLYFPLIADCFFSPKLF